MQEQLLLQRSKVCVHAHSNIVWLIRVISDLSWKWSASASCFCSTAAVVLWCNPHSWVDPCLWNVAVQLAQNHCQHVCHLLILPSLAVLLHFTSSCCWRSTCRSSRQATFWQQLITSLGHFPIAEFWQCACCSAVFRRIEILSVGMIFLNRNTGRRFVVWIYNFTL